MKKIQKLTGCMMLVALFVHAQPQPLQIKTTLVASDFVAPVALETARDNSNRLFICEQTGKIKIIKDGKVLEKPFLDLSKKLDRIGKAYSEKGLLGLAFHPKYKTNGRFFVYYSAPEDDKRYEHKSVIAEYKVSEDPDLANALSEVVILEIQQPESNHNGGQLAFGSEGYLYIGSGDGGGAGDKHGEKGNAQDINNLLGKILRIDVDSKKPYAIPKDNPFASINGARGEIYAWGLRNPWRFSFDRKTNKLFCADVGQDKWEEVDIIQKGKNYGWRIMEGNHCFNPSSQCNQADLQLPVAEYGHSMGISVTGGYVYRGTKKPAMQGRYIFGDWKGNMYYLEEAQGKWKLNPLRIEGKKENDFKININSFGEDEQGELYILSQKFTGTFMSNGAVYKIE